MPRRISPSGAIAVRIRGSRADQCRSQRGGRGRNAARHRGRSGHPAYQAAGTPPWHECIGHDERLRVGRSEGPVRGTLTPGQRTTQRGRGRTREARKSMVPPIGRTGSNPVRARLAELVAIERLIADSLDGWADRVREHPEATALVDRLRTISRSERPLEPALDATAGPPVRAASPVPGVAGVPPAASDVVRQIGQVALAATFACEAAHQTARLSADADTCDLVEARLGEYAATLFDTRRVLPHVVARELRRAGVTCVCRCPACEYRALRLHPGHFGGDGGAVGRRGTSPNRGAGPARPTAARQPACRGRAG
jgi:hypothetical protein